VLAAAEDVAPVNGIERLRRRGVRGYKYRNKKCAERETDFLECHKSLRGGFGLLIEVSGDVRGVNAFFFSVSGCYSEGVLWVYAFRSLGLYKSLTFVGDFSENRLLIPSFALHFRTERRDWASKVRNEGNA
jgi:hypothetical protein